MINISIVKHGSVDGLIVAHITDANCTVILKSTIANISIHKDIPANTVMVNNDFSLELLSNLVSAIDNSNQAELLAAFNLAKKYLER